MGVVIRQGIKQSVINYLGVVVGAISVLFIYPLALQKAELGLLRFIIDTGTLLMPFMLLGANQISVRFFPYFKTTDSERNHGLLSLLLIIVFIASCLVSLLAFIFKTPIYDYYANKSASFVPVLPYVLPIASLFAFFMLFYGYAQNFKLIAIPHAINTLYIKVAIPLLALAYYFGFISFQQILLGVVVVYGIINISHFIYLRYLGKWHLNLDFIGFLDRQKFKEIMGYAFYAMVGNIGSIVVIRVDSIMVASLASDGLANNGVYTISAFIANTIATPTSAIMGIAMPLVAQFWANNQLEEIKNLYQKSSLNLLIVGFWLYACVAIGLPYLFQIMPKGEEYAVGSGVILVLGASKLFDMATSINDPIIAMSKNYKFNFYALLILAIMNIIGNYFLIAEYGILGAAIASFISLFLFNTAKFIFIWWKFDMQPFTLPCAYLVPYILGAYAIAHFIPQTGFAALDLLLKCGTISLIFGFLVIFSNASPDLNKVLKNIISKIKALY